MEVRVLRWAAYTVDRWSNNEASYPQGKSIHAYKPKGGECRDSKRLYVRGCKGDNTFKRENEMACQQAKFTAAEDLADFVGQLVQIGCEFDIVQTGASEWTVDLSGRG